MIYKLGVGSFADARLIFRDFGVTMQGVLDLRLIALMLGEYASSLSKMSERYLGIELNKRLACSEWDRDTLTRAEIKYAALDAYVGIRIFDHLTLKIWPRMNTSCRSSNCDYRLPTRNMSVCDGFCRARRRIDDRIGIDL